MEGIAGLHGWQWIVGTIFYVFEMVLTIVRQFLIEGLMTIVLAMLSFFFMHDVSSLLPRRMFPR